MPIMLLMLLMVLLTYLILPLIIWYKLKKNAKRIKCYQHLFEKCPSRLSLS